MGNSKKQDAALLDNSTAVATTTENNMIAFGDGGSIFNKADLKAVAENAIVGSSLTGEFYDWEAVQGVPVRMFIIGTRLVESLNEKKKAEGVKERAIEIYVPEDDCTYITGDVVFVNASLAAIEKQTGVEGSTIPSAPILVEATFKEYKGAANRQYKNIVVSHLLPATKF